MQLAPATGYYDLFELLTLCYMQLAPATGYYNLFEFTCHLKYSLIS